MSDSKNTGLITLGQASCLVLSLPPSEENRRKAKEIISKSSFDVTFLKNTDPMVPVAIGKVTKKLNPFLYCSYPETPPFSDNEEDEETDEVENLDEEDDYGYYNPADVKSKKTFKKAVSNTKLLKFSKEIFLLNNPLTPHYDYMFLTSKIQYDIIKEHFDVKHLSQKAYAALLSRSDIISYATTWRGIRGRWVYVMKKQYRDLL